MAAWLENLIGELAPAAAASDFGSIFSGFCRGSGSSVIRVVPYAALHFMAYEHYRRLIIDHHSTLDQILICLLISFHLPSIMSSNIVECTSRLLSSAFNTVGFHSELVCLLSFLKMGHTYLLAG